MKWTKYLETGIEKKGQLKTNIVSVLVVAQGMITKLTD